MKMRLCTSSWRTWRLGRGIQAWKSENSWRQDIKCCNSMRGMVIYMPTLSTSIVEICAQICGCSCSRVSRTHLSQGLRVTFFRHCHCNTPPQHLCSQKVHNVRVWWHTRTWI
jgi:hypothetical protein